MKKFLPGLNQSAANLRPEQIAAADLQRITIDSGFLL